MAEQGLHRPHHGGDILRAARNYAIDPGQWLDLSTGINPHGWPVPVLTPACWQRLPQEQDGLVEAARLYYQAAHVLPVAGSQAAIQLLPRLRTACRVGIVSPAYAEHAHAWRLYGHEVVSLGAEEVAAQLPGLDVLLLINPNNPTGVSFSRERLLQWRELLVERGGWLVVDEAFVDATPERSIADACGEEGLIVLRSLGKFFGLAGARVGFVLAWPALLQAMDTLLGPWCVSGPSREVARRALQDRPWQELMRGRLRGEGERLVSLLDSYALTPAGGTALFQYCLADNARYIYDRLAANGILVRYFDEPSALRFGLPASEAAWKRLEAALVSLCGSGKESVCR